MAKKIINFNFNGDFCKELEYLEKSYPTSEVSTEYCTTAPSRIKEYATDTYVAEMVANYLGNINTLHVYSARTTDGKIIAEYAKPGHDTQVCIGRYEGGEFVFEAGLVEKGTGMLSQLGEGHKGTVFMASLMPIILKNTEAMQFKDVLENYTTEDEEYSKAMCGLCNNMYYRLKDDKSTAPIPYSQSLDKITQAHIDDCKIEKVFCGEPHVFSRVIVATTSSEEKEEEKEAISVSATSIRDLYKLDPKRVLTKEEEARVPKLDDWYVVPTWALKTAKRILKSQKFRNPCKNILLYGPSGTGKTDGSKAIAEMLGLPYYSDCCSPDDDKLDRIGQLIPNVNKTSSLSVDEKCESLSIPTFDDVENDFEESFKILFGKEPTKLDSPADCYKEISKRLMELPTDDNDFVFVESELIQAIKYGGFCEIQEANIVKNAAVMEVLNPLLAGGDNAFIKLQTGEVIKRHPDCIICFTINREYEGCRELQEAVYSRINLIKQIPEPTAEELMKRTKAQTGFKDEKMLTKMAQCIVDIHEYSREKDIANGVCGPRELIDWAQMAMLESEDNLEKKVSESSVILAAFDTVIEKAAQNEEDIEDILVGVFKKHFSPSKVNTLRAERA